MACFEGKTKKNIFSDYEVLDFFFIIELLVLV
jgi:hypothetical protein